LGNQGATAKWFALFGVITLLIINHADRLAATQTVSSLLYREYQTIDSFTLVHSVPKQKAFRVGRLFPLQNSTKSARMKRPCQKGRKDALLQKQRLARSPSKSIWKGGEAGMGRFLLKLFVLVVILALALSIKAY